MSQQPTRNAVNEIARSLKGQPPVASDKGAPANTGASVERPDNATAGAAPGMEGKTNAPTNETDRAALEANLEQGESLEQGVQSASSGIHHEALQERYGSDIERGKGYSPQELIDVDRKRLQRGDDPYQVASKITSGTPISPEDFALVRAEHERLVADALTKERALQDDPSREARESYEDARQAAASFAKNVIKPPGTMAGDLMRGLQLKPEIPLDTMTGFEQAVIDRLGRELKPSERAAALKSVRSVDFGGRDADAAAERISEQLARESRAPRDWIPDESEVAKVLDDLLEDLIPCRR